MTESKPDDATESQNTANVDVTTLLGEASQGARGAWDRLLPLIYDELRLIADSHMRREVAKHTLQPTALVHEAFVRIAGQEKGQFVNRAHFYGAVACVMRRILVDHARSRRAAKRGGGIAPQLIAVEDVLIEFEDRATDLLDLDDALQRLSQMDPEHSRIVELRFFAGLTVQEAADVMGVSASTVERGWRLARAWLYRQLHGDEQDR